MGGSCLVFLLPQVVCCDFPSGFACCFLVMLMLILSSWTSGCKGLKSPCTMLFFLGRGGCVHCVVGVQPTNGAGRSHDSLTW